MMIRRLADAIRRQDWTTVCVELLVVILGIFIALQVDGWNEARKDRILEQRYLERLAEELTLDIQKVESGLEMARARREMGDMLIRSLEDSSIARNDPTRFIAAVERAGWTYIPVTNDSTYEEIKFAGNLGIIENEALRQSITGYYKLIDGYQQWEYLREANQIAYSAAVNGILTPEQFRRVEGLGADPGSPINGSAFTTEEAEQALANLRDRREFVDQLPRSTSKQIDIALLNNWLRAARTLQRDISDELGHGDD